jgi:two-component system chemotaxis sensor kinase CheA
MRELDTIAGHVLALATPGQANPGSPGEPPSAPANQRAGEEPIRTVRVEIAEMDALLDGVTETHALLDGLRTTLRSIEAAQRLAGLVAARLEPQSGTSVHLQPTVATEKIHALADDLRHSIGDAGRRLASAVSQIDRELLQLGDTAEQLRLIASGTLFNTLERTARDAAHAMSKEIEFEASGGNIRLDADILATMQSALVQTVRNAVAHGIETPSARRAAGKPNAGRISIAISRRGNRIVFTCRDDGSGVDLAGVRRAALRRGLGASVVNQFSAQDLIHLLLRGGISTSETVSEIAGRGVGLDIMREAIHRLGGTVEVTTETGLGTAFALTVPLSLVSMEVLIVEAGSTVAAIPLDAVRGAVWLGADAIARSAAGATVLYGQQAIPFLWLPRALGGEPLPTGRKWSTFIVAVAAGMLAVGVDRLLGTTQIVVRPLPELAPADAIIAGAAFDSEGNPRLVLDPEGLLAAVRQRDLAEPTPEPVRHPVLVIDDSLTTRMLEQSILESAGYEVDLAVSAEEALEIARRKRYALFLVDVEMPGMDGFEFVENIRADPELHDIPAVLVTSRSAPEDRQRARDAGARGYVVKGEFDQAELLAMMRPLIG